ncbi:MAG: hypothetical protein JWM80_1559 [Cyanobacteria bacterium RYN_339]|nr:hypothetical protein [Cyanobacteria bacterium RYN_339]
MMSPGFIDLMLFIVLVAFSIKGWSTGFIRTVVTLLAVIGGWILSGMVPDLTGGFIHYNIPESSIYFHVATRITTYMLTFAAVQVAGFTITGLIENIKLGTLDKFVGVALGIATGVLVGCFVVSTFYVKPATYWSPAGQRYLKNSMFFKAYSPMVSKFVHKPRKPADTDEDT